MKYFGLWILTVAAALAPVQAQELWRGASYGISRDSIQILFPDAFTPVDGSSLYGGAVERARVEGLEHGGYPLVASFYLLNDKLHQIIVRLADPKSYEAAEPAFVALSDVLRSEHGEEMSSESKRSTFGRRMKRIWERERGGTVTMLLSGDDDDALLNIIYKATRPPPASYRRLSASERDCILEKLDALRDRLLQYHGDESIIDEIATVRLRVSSGVLLLEDMARLTTWSRSVTAN